MKKSKINNKMNVGYEFTLKIKNEKNILIGIIKTIQGLFLSKVVLTKKQQHEILENYKNLVNIKTLKPDDDTVYLLTPKPVALKKINLDNPDNYGVISILNYYMLLFLLLFLYLQLF